MSMDPEQIARDWLLKYYPWGERETWSQSTIEAWNRNWTMLKDFVRDCWPKEPITLTKQESSALLGLLRDAANEPSDVDAKSFLSLSEQFHAWLHPATPERKP